ncbi:flavonol synthase/flavanone 3-hydroxylase-like [Cucurbita maxima]|uniref:Flavonol synthase/flavanone 3-hydroxylase-like n=1 Tax=Cucurbita maxima TaxID=3661 RepID=O23763_CUCMA|nr:flavonol synthase/flavanone 3-hydroxylase-like [Cucurbita maxima]AAB64346.1 gibberellin 7-oxidase [Cucurbita maxima]
MANTGIPTVDVSLFLSEGENEAKKQAIQTITEACSSYGFFQIVNHGIPIEFLKEALQLSKTFFHYPDEIKLQYSPKPGAPLLAGFNKQKTNCVDKNEYVLVFPPGSKFNIYPQEPPQFKETLEEMFLKLSDVSLVIESILNVCLGLPPGFLKQFNNDRSWDFMTNLYYYPAADVGENGLIHHEDANCITLVIQDDAGGLQVQKDSEWIPVTPVEGAIVVNVGDIIQVLSNKKFKSATHRVVRQKGKERYSFAFFRSLHGDKWVEPLPEFTKEIGEKPKYKGFEFNEYLALRLKNKTHPPSRVEDEISIKHYEIN